MWLALTLVSIVVGALLLYAARSIIRIRALIDDRTRMLAGISHDLRTPLARLRLRAERASIETREGMLRDIERISRMLDDTLEYLRQDRRSEPLERVDLASLLQTICSEFSDVGHEVSYRGPAHHAWLCRPNALTRAITNVVDNGVKYGGRATVSLSVCGSGSVTQIEICDEGPGVPASLRERVLEPFFRVETVHTREAPAGFGLGLAIARDIVRSHGGGIELIEAKPAGLIVRISLPRLIDQGHW